MSNSSNNKFHFVCRNCKHEISDFKEWFSYGQKCPKCGKNWVDTVYSQDINKYKELIFDNGAEVKSLWHYFDFLPLNDKKNIITNGEGVIDIDNWKFLEKFAKEQYNVDCTVYAYRNDDNYGTGTFKDAAATLVASVLKENNIKEYAVASTGNVANAFARYLAEAGISLSVFIPNDALKANEAEVSSYGQRVYRVDGDYAKAKKIAAEFSKKHNVLLSSGNTDPMRVESKKVMLFEWLRILGEVPNVYIQALSGGTGPIAINKAFDDVKELGIIKQSPRYILVQPSRCAPMTEAWQKAKANNFPEGWEQDYPIYDNPKSKVPTLATGNPATYPIISKIVKDSGGEIIEYDEDKLVDISRLVAFETTVRMGPAAAVAVGGFFDSLKNGYINNGDRVMINIGEGVRRAPDFMKEMIYTTKKIKSVDDCENYDRESYRDQLWKPFK
ncbi:MAG: hypothetical protein DRJ01_02715 [Bacteroidetes bacterium]|nr:MAG: hypothetical protein DRJ01_02715 [Bacteroidota bacterium]